MDRIVDLDSPASLRVRYDCLIVERAGQDAVSIPGADLVVLVLGHRDIALTSSVLALLAKCDAAVLSLDERFLPVGLTLPIAAHSRHTQILRSQIALSTEKKEAFWTSLVAAKIEGQAQHLDDLGKKHGLREIQDEAQAAKAYFRILFGPEFSRRDEDDESNAALNYGYAVLRALVARTVCKAGLHPALGIHHENKYNPFVLADDLIEPFRPRIDAIVLQLGETNLTKDTKRTLLCTALEAKEDVEKLVRRYVELL